MQGIYLTHDKSSVLYINFSLFHSHQHSFTFIFQSLDVIFYLFFLQPHNDGKYVFDIGCEQHGHYEYIEKVKNEQNQLEQ